MSCRYPSPGDVTVSCRYPSPCVRKAGGSSHQLSTLLLKCSHPASFMDGFVGAVLTVWVVSSIRFKRFSMVVLT